MKTAITQFNVNVTVTSVDGIATSLDMVEIVDKNQAANIISATN